ncbi:MAG TPA: hypothetical protein VGL71_13055, partial [Urbifossiella sp.]
MAGTIRRSLAAVAILAVTVFGRAEAAPAGAPTPINLSLPYPQKAPLVVHIHGFERVKERLAKMLDALPPEQAKQLKKGIDDGFAQLLKGRSLDGVPKEGRVFVVVHDFAKLVDGEPAISVIVPATSYKEFKDSLLTAEERKSIEKAGNGIESMKSSAVGDEQTLYMVELKGYVALSPSKETAETYVGKYTWSQSGSMGMDLSSSFLAADVAIYVNMQAINDLYGEQIKQFKGLIDFGLGQAQNMGMIPGLGKQQLDLAKIMIGGMFQGVEDSQGIVLAAEFRPAGLNLRGQIRFADETQSSDLLKPEQPTPLAGLNKLPKGLSTYGASKFGKKFSDLGKKFAQEFQAADDDEKGAGRIDKLLAEVESSGRIGEISASSAPEQSMTITGYKSPEKAVTAIVKIYEGLESGGKVSTIALKQKPTVTNKAATFRDFTFTEVKLVFDFAATVEALPEPARDAAIAQFKRMMKEKTTFWLGTDGKVVVQMTAKDFNAAKKMLGDYLDDTDAVGSDPGFLLARKNLPADVSLLYMLETGQVVSMLVEQAKAVGQAIPGGAGFPPFGSVKPVKGEATYIGVAVTLKPQTAGFD